MLSFRFRVVKFAGPDGTSQCSIRGVGHDDTGHPVKLAGEAVAVAHSEEGVDPADDLREQLQTMIAATNEPIVAAASLAPDEESDWPVTPAAGV